MARKNVLSELCVHINENKTSFERIHTRIDKGESDMKRITVTLWGDPEKNIIGFLQSYAQFATEMKMYMKIIAIIGTSVTVALIGAVVKMWFIQ